MSKRLATLAWLLGFIAAEVVMFWFGEVTRFGLVDRPPAFWPAIGVYFAAAVRFPRRLLGPLTLVALPVWLVVPAFTHGHGVASAQILPWLANTVAVFAGALMYRRYGLRWGRGRAGRELVLFLMAAVLVPVVSATALKAMTSVTTLEPWASSSWQNFFEADGLGMLVVAPFLLSVTEPGALGRAWKERRQASLGLGLLVIVLAASLALFVDVGLPGIAARPFMVLPFLVLVAFQGEHALSATATFVVALVVVAATSQGYGPFLYPVRPLTFVIGEMQIFIAVETLMTIILTDAIHARQVLAARLAEESHSRAAAEQRLELAVEAAGLGVWEARRDDGVATWSDRWREILGVPPGVPASREAFLAAVAPEDRERMAAAVERAPGADATGGRGDDFAVVWPDGSRHVARIRSKAYHADGSQRVAGTLQDVTDEVAARKALERAEQVAVAASQEKSRFLATMSHEIRSPLGAMLGFTDLLLDPATAPEERRRYVELIRRNGQHLNELVDQILDLSKVEAGRLEIVRRTVDLRELLDDVMALMAVKASDKGLTLACTLATGVPRVIETDPLRFRQILINALGNAVKFTAAGRVGLVVDAAADRRGRWRLQIDVTDTGIGLTKEEQAPLFQPFTQANAQIAGRYGGTGLGLALSRHLAQLLGGDYVLQHSEKGVGSVFRLTIDAGAVAALPVEPVGAGRTAAPTPQAAPVLRGRRILLADDFADSRLLVRRYLELAGASVATVENGREAVDAALAESFDVVLMDLQMPELDGLGAVSLLRERAYAGAVVALTGRTMADEVQAALAAGFDAHVGKPIDRRALLATLSSVLH